MRAWLKTSACVVIFLSGGLRAAAAQVQREVNHQMQSLTPTPDFLLQPKDVIVVIR